jgi:hypothetical protein
MQQFNVDLSSSLHSPERAAFITLIMTKSASRFQPAPESSLTHRDAKHVQHVTVAQRMIEVIGIALRELKDPYLGETQKRTLHSLCIKVLQVVS